MTYSCMPGHTLNGNKNKSMLFTATCKANGAFTPLPSCLPVNCGAAPAVSHAVPSAVTGVSMM